MDAYQEVHCTVVLHGHAMSHRQRAQVGYERYPDFIMLCRVHAWHYPSNKSQGLI